MHFDKENGKEHRTDSNINDAIDWQSMEAAIGNSDFKDIRDKGGYFVDKSELIDGILKRRSTKVFLFTRPRRFGKSLNLSMIDAYLNLKYKGNTWFDGLKISEMRQDDPVKNSCPVINLDLKAVYAGTVEKTINFMRLYMMDVYGDFPELRDSDKLDSEDRQQYQDYRSGNVDGDSVAFSLLRLSKMLRKHYGKKVTIIIDEYDSPINHMFGNPELRGTIDFFRMFLTMALKGNDSLDRAILTGVMQISKESIFSGLNNLYTNSILSTGFDDMFGFTENEVQKLCADFGAPEKFAEAKEWYDGYRFGNADVYNPWSVLNYVNDRFKPDTYWGKTGANDIIAEMVSRTDADTFSKLSRLASGDEVVAEIRSDITYDDLSNPAGKNLYSVMAATGYLRAEEKDGKYLISIPNWEMREVYSGVILEPYWNAGLKPGIETFCNAVAACDTAAMESSLHALMESAFSVRMLDSEHVYQAIVVSLLLNLRGAYTLDADREAGSGYYDIRLKSRDIRRPSIIIKIKRARASDPAEAAMNALCQIREKGYGEGLSGTVLLYGIAFSGKDVSVAADTLPASPSLSKQ